MVVSTFSPPEFFLEGHSRSASWGAAFGAWLAMTAVMMTPVVIPWLRTLSRLGSTRRTGLPAEWTQRASQSATLFGVGYGFAWATFSAGAATVQISLSAAGINTPLLGAAPLAAAVALVLIGGYQFTGIKNRCLAHCRSPAGYMIDHWKPGRSGSLRMGLGHGLFCLGCCWALMLLALVVGAMDLRWMLLLTLVMVVETAVPHGHRITRPIGALLVVGGLATLLP